MIIFSSSIPNDEIVSLSKDKLSIINLCSLYYGFDTLDIIYSNNKSGVFVFQHITEQDEINYDFEYHTQLVNNPIYFSQIMEKVIIPSMMDYYVIILVNDLNSFIMQSFIKFIQLRYGCKCFICDCIEDLKSIVMDEISSFDNIFNYDLDNNRYMNYLTTGFLEPVSLI